MTVVSRRPPFRSPHPWEAVHPLSFRRDGATEWATDTVPVPADVAAVLLAGRPPIDPCRAPARPPHCPARADVDPCRYLVAMPEVQCAGTVQHPSVRPRRGPVPCEVTVLTTWETIRAGVPVFCGKHGGACTSTGGGSGRSRRKGDHGVRIDL